VLATLTVESLTADAHLPSELRALSLEVQTAKREVIEPLMVEAGRREDAADHWRKNHRESLPINAPANSLCVEA